MRLALQKVQNKAQSNDLREVVDKALADFINELVSSAHNDI